MCDQTRAALVVVAGPTGSGKSELALRLAEVYDGEIVNCDSLQIYRHLDIGTAKLPETERRGIPHHLIDILDPDEVFTAGEYARRARLELRDITARGKLPIVAGGTGFYIRALIDGLFEGPAADPAVRARLSRREERRPGSLHRLLSRFDPASASRIHATDRQKLIRALEVFLKTGRPLSEWFSDERDALTGYRVLKLYLDPPRQALYARLNERARRMFEGGLIDEVRAVLAAGFPENSKALEALGYKEALEVLAGKLSLEEAIERTQIETRHYAKRQVTWFRKECGIVPIPGFGDEPEAQDTAFRHVREFLNYG